VRLADVLDISFSDEDRWFLAEMNPYNLEAKYPQTLNPLPDKNEINRININSPARI